jgi:hypothetical protein
MPSILLPACSPLSKNLPVLPIDELCSAFALLEQVRFFPAPVSSVWWKIQYLHMQTWFAWHAQRSEFEEHVP